MLSIKTLSVLALAGSAIAAPQGGWGNWGNYFNGGRHGDNDNKEVSNDNVQTDVEVVTAYTTVTQNGRPNFGGYQAQPTQPAAAVETWVAKPSQHAAPSGGQPVASSGGDGYMGVVSAWRSKMGMSGLTEDSTLVGNAAKTARDGNGKMVHQLNPGSFAQVLAPGSAGDFEKVFVGGWLCELPNTPGLNGICGQMSQGWAYDGQTGHAEILTSSKYSKIGCANAGGIWSCDLA